MVLEWPFLPDCRNLQHWISDQYQPRPVDGEAPAHNAPSPPLPNQCLAFGIPACAKISRMIRWNAGCQWCSQWRAICRGMHVNLGRIHWNNFNIQKLCKFQRKICLSNCCCTSYYQNCIQDINQVINQFVRMLRLVVHFTSRLLLALDL